MTPNPLVMWARLAAILVDSLLITVGQGLLGHYFPSFHLRLSTAGGALSTGLDRQGADLLPRLGLAAVLYFIYFALFEMTAGRTPGKALAGLRVVDLAGRPVSPAAALVRNLFRPIDAAGAYLLGAFVALGSSRRQRIGDHAAGTMVVDARSAAVGAGASRRGRIRLMQVTGAALVFLLLAGATSYFRPPPLIYASSAAFYPVNGPVFAGYPDHVRRVERLRIIRTSSSPGKVVYSVDFDAIRRKGSASAHCTATISLRWSGPVTGWTFGDYSEACASTRRG